MILIGVVGLAFVIGVPYLLENSKQIPLLRPAIRFEQNLSWSPS